MVRWLLNKIAERLPCRVIEGNDGSHDVYLERYTLIGWKVGDEPKPFSVYLHRFVRPDGDIELHSHPWAWAVSLVLVGGYEEERMVRGEDPLDDAFEIVTRTLSRWSVNLLSSSTFHRVSRLLEPESWTLIVVGPKVQDWEFMDRSGKRTPWRDFLRSKGVEPAY